VSSQPNQGKNRTERELRCRESEPIADVGLYKCGIVREGGDRTSRTDRRSKSRPGGTGNLEMERCAGSCGKSGVNRIACTRHEGDIRKRLRGPSR